MRHPDVLILGAGVIGLSLALELRSRGSSVVVLDPRTPLSQASTAAAGMLAVEDPHNRAELLPLSRLSGSLYAAFLSRVKALSGLPVPFQTDTTLQTMPNGGVRELHEHSIDPRQLAPALLAAVLALGVEVMNGEAGAASLSSRLLMADQVVHASGAWTSAGIPVTPRKGQMLRVKIPEGMALNVVHRTEHVYVVPRTQGSQEGTALIGATVEDAGFDLSTSPMDLARLRGAAAALVPQLASAFAAPSLEAWAGLRPATPDGLPILSQLERADGARARRSFVASGHFRNGILLAPATAVVMADLLEDRVPAVNLKPFAASRFALLATG